MKLDDLGTEMIEVIWAKTNSCWEGEWIGFLSGSLEPDATARLATNQIAIIKIGGEMSLNFSNDEYQKKVI